MDRLINENKIKYITNLIIEEIKNIQQPPKLISLNENKAQISEGLEYHIKNEVPLVENVYRIYSKEFFNLFEESRRLLMKVYYH